MNILALDLATTTGWAVLRGERVSSGIWKLKAKGDAKDSGARYQRLHDYVSSVRAVTQIDRVYFEEVRRHNGTDAAHVYGGLVAVLKMWCDARGIPYVPVPVGAIKKHATGKGNAGKDAMIAAARARGWLPCDDNEADALWILDKARNQEGEKE